MIKALFTDFMNKFVALVCFYMLTGLLSSIELKCVLMFY